MRGFLWKEWTQKQANTRLAQLDAAEKLYITRMTEIRNFEPKHAPFGLSSKVDTGRNKMNRSATRDECEEGSEEEDDDATTQPGQMMSESGFDSPAGSDGY